MPAVEKISIALTPDLATLVRQAVASGEYASTSEVIRDALRDWKIKQATRQEQIEELRRLWTQGVQSGPGRFVNMDALIEEARSRFSVQREPS